MPRTRRLLVLLGLSSLAPTSHSFTNTMTAFRAAPTTRQTHAHAPLAAKNENEPVAADVLISSREALERAFARSLSRPATPAPRTAWPTSPERSPLPPSTPPRSEIELLSMLTGPTATSAYLGLWSLWSAESGDEASTKALEEAASTLVGSHVSFDTMERAADTFLDLSIKHPDWVEPLHRLSLVRFHQGRFDNALGLALAVQRSKPWHFGAIQIIVAAYQRLGDYTRSERWSEWLLPPDLSAKNSNGETVRLRTGWIRFMVDQYAQMHLVPRHESPPPSQ